MNRYYEAVEARQQVRALQIEVDRVRVALVTLLIWMSGSAGSPLRHDELQRLIHIAEGTREQP